MIARHLATLFSLWCLIVLSAQAAEFPKGPEALAESLPNLFLKLNARQPIHVAFVGDGIFMDQAGQASSASSFLSELSETFYYTGGVFEVYDERHLTVTSPKITYEQLAIERPNCFNLMQYVSTLGLLNDPDLLVVFTGPADADQEVALPEYVAQLDAIAATTKAAGTELVFLAPRLLDWEKGDQPVNLPTRAYASLLGWWCDQQGLPFVDPNTSLLPQSVLFGPGADPKTIWTAFVDEVNRSKEQRGTTSLPWRALTSVGKQLFRELAGEKPATPRLEVDVAAVGPEKLTLRLTNTTKTALDGMTVTNIETSAGVIGRGFTIPPGEANAIELPLTSIPATLRGLLPVTCLSIDDRRVQLSNLMTPIADVGVEWLDRGKHNTPHKATIPVRCQVFPYKEGLRQLKYVLRAGNESTQGNLVFANRKPAEIDWSIELPQSPEESLVQQDIQLILGEGDSAITLRRRMEAVRQLALNSRIEMTSLTEGKAQAADEQSANLVKPSLTFTPEASEDEISFHFDFKNIALPSTIGRPALELDLAIDARPFDKRQTVGHVGVLQVTASANDGPATISPAAPLAHFGNGYARRPLPSGIQSRLSTRPNGDRRLTVQMVRKYFYLHPWQLENANSQLGIRATISIAQKGKDTPVVYALHAAHSHPNNAEALTILELAEQGTKRWCVKFWDPRD